MGGGDASNDFEEEVAVNICCSNGSKFSVQVKLDSTIEFFKSILAEKCNIPPQQQRLIYKGRILKDDQTLESYGVEADHTVHLVRGFASSASVDSAAVINSGVPNTNPISATDTGSNEGRLLGASGFGSTLFSRLGLNGSGSAGLFGAAIPDMEQMQQEISEDSDMLGGFLEIPLVQNLMNNPETIRNMITSSPQMREIMDRNPELAHVLNDPATVRQTMEAARNPELMREMMRHTDRAMSNIESSPEGFNMLRRMYENVEEPFLNATATAGENISDLGSNPFAAFLGAQGGDLGSENMTNTTNSHAPNTIPLPNPWASAGTGGTQTNSNARSNSTGGATPTSLGGLGGLGFPISFIPLLQNPTESQMMSSLLSSPEHVNQIPGINPQLRNMRYSNPHIRDMMQNPDFIRLSTSPETIQQHLSSIQALSSQPASQELGQNASVTGPASIGHVGFDSLMNMFGGIGTAGGFNAQNRPQVPPEEQYATQLVQLTEMGFFDAQENIRALIATAGNVNAAVERLLGNTGQ
ncbi:hypothetical protein RD792_001145 [Penstemon davidsonii]|uniref:Uncharacterized protein n=1 Tax=Penstemon davidsonii TaxID=160366 RepID=A0ABR0DNR7_9LAMI|nr:hypothetical protein RD792_001145 [Penstemon davidsonii]